MILKVLLSESQAKLNLTTAEFILKVAGIDINKCPCCSGKMVTMRKIEPRISGPPDKNSKTA